MVKCFRGLGSTLNVDALGRCELSELVPEVLGAPIWAIIKTDDTWHSWKELKDIVEARWGLTQEQLREAFFPVRPEKSERPERFVLRVEDARKKLKVDDETTLNVFRHYLPHAMLLKLDDLQVMAAMIAGKGVV